MASKKKTTSRKSMAMSDSESTDTTMSTSLDGGAAAETGAASLPGIETVSDSAAAGAGTAGDAMDASSGSTGLSAEELAAKVAAHDADVKQLRAHIAELEAALQAASGQLRAAPRAVAAGKGGTAPILTRAEFDAKIVEECKALDAEADEIVAAYQARMDLVPDSIDGPEKPGELLALTSALAEMADPVEFCDTAVASLADSRAAHEETTHRANRRLSVAEHAWKLARDIKQNYQQPVEKMNKRLEVLKARAAAAE